MAHLIRKGDASSFPELVTEGFTITYTVPGNSYSVGKTNFWSYEDQLFGVNLEDNVGLTGKTLADTMDAQSDYFEALGIPITPYTDNDLQNESPYQLALLKAYNAQGVLVDSTQPVIPVSNEMYCVSSGCHSSELNILEEHEDDEEGGISPSDRPVLCSACHADPALGQPGNAGLRSLSRVIHGEHAERTNDCYKCHPGETTKCLRGVMFMAGLTCQDCHGSVQNVAQTIDQGRRPWLDEPRCGSDACHGSNFAENPETLFRLSRGHAGLFCATCHGSPHAILPSSQPNDNLQNINLQGVAGVLTDCKVCHGVNPPAAGPHGILPTGVRTVAESIPHQFKLYQNYPNPFNMETSISVHVASQAAVRLDIFDLQGRLIKQLYSGRLNSGRHTFDWAGVNEAGVAVPSGTYICKFTANEESVFTRKLTVIK